MTIHTLLNDPWRFMPREGDGGGAGGGVGDTGFSQSATGTATVGDTADVSLSDFGQTISSNVGNDFGSGDISGISGTPSGTVDASTLGDTSVDVGAFSPTTNAAAPTDIGSRVAQMINDRATFARENPTMFGIQTALSLANPISAPVMGLGMAMNALGATPSTNNTPGGPDAAGAGQGGAETLSVQDTQQATAPAPVPAPFSLGAPPGVLNLSPAMSPLQQRAAIATGGVSGNSGIYTSDIARKYYADLLRSSRPEVGDLLPVERQYASRLGVSNYPNTQRLLEAISAV